MVHSPPGRPSAAIRAMPLLSDRAYERIRHDIISCVIAPGTEISEAQLCTHYKLGKAPVRMALNRLAHDGLVRAIPRRGYRVTPVTLKDIHDVFELRLMLEPAAARMAAGKVNAQRLKALDEACRAGYQPGDPRSTARFLEANKAFHVAIARATGNARLADAVERQLDEMTRWVLDHLGPDVPLHFTAFHPDYKMTDLPRTPPSTLTRAREIALAEGLHYVYTGNVHDEKGGSTYCPGCRSALVIRDWYRIDEYRITPDGKCPDCGTAIAGRFETFKRAFGPRRIPVAIHRAA